MENIQTQEQLPAPSESKTNSKGMKFLAGVGVVALLIAAAWLGVQAVAFGTNITGGLANTFSGVRLFFSGSDDITLVAEPGIIATEDTFVLSWEHEGETLEGSYTFTYECTDGVHIQTPSSENNGNVVFCNSPFSFLGSDNTLELSAITINEGATDVALEISFTETGSDEVTAVGETSITVVDDPALIEEIAGSATSTPETDEEEVVEETQDEAVEETPQPLPLPTTQPVTIVDDATPVNNPNGTPDLTVNILSVGILTSDDVYIQQSGPLDPDEDWAVRFEVVNNGDKDSGVWSFEAELPTEPRYDYESKDQETLFPGTRVEYTLGFDDVEDDDESATLTITVDHEEDVDESDENNNSDGISFDILTE